MTNEQRAWVVSRRARYVLGSFAVGRARIDIVRPYMWGWFRPRWFGGLPGFWQVQAGPVVVWWINEAEARKAVPS